MKKTILAISLSLLVAISAEAQNVSHKIVAGETLSALAAKYGTTVGDIMRYNGMNASSQLSIGQIIKIPPTATKAKTAEPGTEKPVPVKSDAKEYVVQKSETLYAISKKFNVSIPQLKSWNRLSTDNIQPGQKLIVSDPMTTPSDNTVSAPETSNKNETAVKSTKTAPEEDSNSEQKSISATSVEVVPATTVTTDPDKKDSETISMSDVPVEGFFKNDFAQQGKSSPIQTVDGTGMVFKTTSGWNDRKYYILMNHAPVGSIVKVTANNKSVYAKVLWKLEEMKLNEGLDFRLSDAAANALGINEPKFNLKIEY